MRPGTNTLKQWLGRANTPKLILLVMVLAAVEVAQSAGIFDPAELVLYDLWHRMAGQRYEPRHVALVVIDEPTLNDFQDDPLAFWTPQVAKVSAVARAAGARIVGLDLLYSVSPEAWLAKSGRATPDSGISYDQPFREEIGGGSLIQVGRRVKMATGFDDFLLPHPDYLMSVPDLDLPSSIALAGLNADKDSAVRSFSILQPLVLAPDVDPTTVPRFGLGPLLALRAEGAALDKPGWTLAGRNYAADSTLIPISFVGPPGSVPRVSMRHLLADDALQRADVQALRGKVVIIGGEYLGMGDLHPTPYASSFFGGVSSYMPGPEIQANIVETLLSGQRMDSLPRSIAHAFTITLAIAGILVFSFLTPAWGLLAFLALTVLSVLLSYVAFLKWVLLPAASAPLVLGIAYLGTLAVKLGAEARERKRVTAIFSRYVSDSVVDVLIDANNTPELGGVKQTITILFSDIRNFTTISEKLDAQEVVEFLNQYFERICEAVLAEGGTIDKFIGDAIMVQFGAPIHYPDHALRATRAAMEMKREAEAFRDWMEQRFPGRDLPTFRIGIGLHTGDVVVGNIGSTRRTEYTVIGDAVNLASRIEGMTKTLGCDVLISRDTLDGCGGKVLTGRTQSVSVKGREAPVELFEVLEVKGDEL